MSHPGAQKAQTPEELCKKPDGAMLTLAADSVVFFAGGMREERTDGILGILDAEKTPVWTLPGRRVPVPATPPPACILAAPTLRSPCSASASYSGCSRSPSTPC